MIHRLLNQLHKSGIIGINRRNIDYVSKYNPRHLYPLVDDKLSTKMLAIQAGITVPELYAVVTITRQARDIHTLLKNHSSFVVKPAQGTGGNGVVIIIGRAKNGYRTLGGRIMSKEALENHIIEILSGIYSLGGHPDKALFEYTVQLDPFFRNITYQGMPDIRIIVFLGVPVMSMVRLPTHLSNGKANLHQGAIGVGIDIATGTTTTGVWHNDSITEHPDTGVEIAGMKMPHWKNLLNLSARCYELTKLGYQGIDIVFDKEKGPMLLELNARPGLNIQIANRAGLLPRLKLVEQMYKTLKSPEDRISFVLNYFSANIDE
ncbi:MAG: alpha-L-glutamate ligase-like protein [Candidatus Brocadiaceae bacterium]|nr:alpha-L-glutamate ligase-like protein [Candidatus Brocadiaceae bacterium]